MRLMEFINYSTEPKLSTQKLQKELTILSNEKYLAMKIKKEQDIQIQALRKAGLGYGAIGKQQKHYCKTLSKNGSLVKITPKRNQI